MTIRQVVGLWLAGVTFVAVTAIGVLFVQDAWYEHRYTNDARLVRELVNRRECGWWMDPDHVQFWQRGRVQAILAPADCP